MKKNTMKNKLLLLVILFSTLRPSAIPGRLPEMILQNEQQDSLSVLTWNVYMLPKIASLSKEIGNTHLEDRAREIGSYLLNSKYDVIVLQEVFDPSGYKILKNILKKKYQFISEPINDHHLIKTHSGLVLLSKYPIYNYKTIKFSDCSSSDCLSNKGAFQACFKLNNRKFRIVGTHLQSDYKFLSEFKEVRKNQIQEIINQFHINPEDKSVTNLFCGDFNISNTDTPQYNYLLNTFKARNFDNSCCNYTWSDYKSKSKDKFFFDYCLVNQNSPNDVICQRVLNHISKQFTIKPSDHFPVELVMQFQEPKLISLNNP